MYISDAICSHQGSGQGRPPARISAAESDSGSGNQRRFRPGGTICPCRLPSSRMRRYHGGGTHGGGITATACSPCSPCSPCTQTAMTSRHMHHGGGITARGQVLESAIACTTQFPVTRQMLSFLGTSPDCQGPTADILGTPPNCQNPTADMPARTHGTPPLATTNFPHGVTRLRFITNTHKKKSVLRQNFCKSAITEAESTLLIGPTDFCRGITGRRNGGQNGDGTNRFSMANGKTLLLSASLTSVE